MKILLKAGSNILIHEGKGGLNTQRIASLARDIGALRADGHDVLLVSSGAVAAGMPKVGLKTYPGNLQLRQAVAAVGQSSLMWAYERYFGRREMKVAQILLTRDDFKDRIRYINARNTLATLLELGFVPVINENDPIAVDEMKFGDNDQLAALVAGMLQVDRMVILSDVPGLFEKDPKKNREAKIIETVHEITPELLGLAGASGSNVGTGGMYSKIVAARKAMSYGIQVHIIDGNKPGILPKLIRGNSYGTCFLPASSDRLSSRKGWIAHGIKSKGTLVLDEGAVRALVDRGKSLLPSGIVRVEGTFFEGDAVDCVDIQGRKIARGLTNYSSDDIRKIRGKKTNQIEAILGYKYSDEAVHRDNLVLASKS